MINVQRSQKIRMYFYGGTQRSFQNSVDCFSAQQHGGERKTYVCEKDYLTKEDIIKHFGEKTRLVINENIRGIVVTRREDDYEVTLPVARLIGLAAKERNAAEQRALESGKLLGKQYAFEHKAMELGYKLEFEPTIPKAVMRFWFFQIFAGEARMRMFRLPARIDESVFYLVKMHETYSTAMKIRDRAFIGYLDGLAGKNDLVSTARYYPHVTFYENLPNPPAIFKGEGDNSLLAKLVMLGGLPGGLNELQIVMIMKEMVGSAVGSYKQEGKLLDVNELMKRLPDDYDGMKKFCMSVAANKSDEVARNIVRALTEG